MKSVIEHTKKQHFVPQFYLKNFSNKKDELYMWDRYRNVVSKQDVRSICYQNDLYETKTEKATILWDKYVLDNQIEKMFGKLESEITPLITRIIQEIDKSTIMMSEYEKDLIIEFVATLYLRNPYVLKIIKKWYLDSYKEKDFEPLQYMLNEMFKNYGGIDDVRPLVEHSVVVGTYNKTLDGSPLNVLDKIIRNMGYLFWRSNERNFVTSCFPLLIDSFDHKKAERIVLPLSNKIAIAFFGDHFIIPTSGMVLDVDDEFVGNINKKYIRMYSEKKNRFVLAKEEKDLDVLRNRKL